MRENFLGELFGIAFYSPTKLDSIVELVSNFPELFAALLYLMASFLF